MGANYPRHGTRDGGRTGLGYTYSTGAATRLIDVMLAPVLLHEDAFAIPHLWDAMVGQVRNLGRQGIAATAISALDTALWDLKARLLDVPLAQLFGLARGEVPIYGSGGFTTYDEARLREQLGAWVREDGCRFVKMKIGRDPGEDIARMAAARDAIGDAALMITPTGRSTCEAARRLFPAGPSESGLPRSAAGRRTVA